ncbi:MAG: hypothetical protein WA873_03305, partial [Jannaschia helgolandensis]
GVPARRQRAPVAGQCAALCQCGGSPWRQGSTPLLDRIDRTIPKDGAKVWQPVANDVAGRTTAFWLAQGDR